MSEEAQTTGQLVLYGKDDHVAVITLNRPEKLNALTPAMLGELDEALRAARDDDDVRVIVLAGAGRAFSAGADLVDFPSGLLDAWNLIQGNHRRQSLLWEIPKVTIAAVHGYCLGRGLELALWCDLVIAAGDARLGQPEVRQGSFVASVVPWLLGPQQAKWFMLSGTMVDAQRAEALGLVTSVAPEGNALDEALRIARQLSHIPPVTVERVKGYMESTYRARGLGAAGEAGAAWTTLLLSLSPEEMGTDKLFSVLEEDGVRAFVKERDRPFEP